MRKVLFWRKEMIKNFCEIRNENCFDTMKNMKNSSIDLILTSPPYNMTSRRGGMEIEVDMMFMRIGNLNENI